MVYSNINAVVSVPQITKVKDAVKITGELGRAGKMPCPTYNTPASMCKTGAKLRKIVGSICHGCYAFKGNYAFPSVQQGLLKRFHAFSKKGFVEAI